jgi:branched-chain amino acid transport system permease protein
MGILPQILANSLIAGATYALVALGFNLIYGTTRFFNLAHGITATVGAYVVFWLCKELGLPVGVGVTTGILAAALFGWLSYRLVFCPMLERKSSGLVMLVAALGIMTAAQAIIAIIFTSQFQTLSTGGANATFRFAGAVVTDVQLIMFGSVIVIALGLGALIKFTRLGRAIRAIGDDLEVSRVVGINTRKVIGIVFAIGSAIAGVAGILIGYDIGIEPTMGMALLLKGVIASIVGGVGTVSGAVLGAFLLGLVENLGVWQFSGEWKDAIAFAVLIIFLLFRPQGIIKR